MKRALSIAFLAGFLGLGLSASQAADSAPSAAAPVDFQRDIQPLLQQRCHECHDARKSKGGLRLDRKAGALLGGDSGKPAVVPGKNSDSQLLLRVTTTNADEHMPPKGEPLTTAQVALLRAWIDQGAPWPDNASEKKHWAYEKPLRHPLPKVKAARWTRNAIDHFVLARLDREKLKPQPEAERALLIRRVSLDLTGLPPSLEEVDAFLADKSTNAYEKVVERLLASPAYGERWARPWLDLARYADTQGFEKDNRRTMWPYRDWVIQALNRDVPFDEFTIEQLAGDLLPEATQDQKVATGFHRNTMTNTEGGTDNEEFRHEAVVDRVNTTFAVWMGTTMACAQCHNHKYDPLTMKEYYRFYAFLNQTADADNDDEKPTMKVPSAEQASKLAKLRTEAGEAEKAFNAAVAKPETARAQTDWEAMLLTAITNWQTLDPTQFVARPGGATLAKTARKSIQASGANLTNDTYTVAAPVVTGRITGLRLEVLETGVEKALGRHENGGFVLGKLDVSAQPTGADTPRAVRLKSATADFSQKEFDITNVIAGTGEGWAVATFEAANKVRRSAYFTLTEPLEFPHGGTLTFTLRHSDKHPFSNIQRFRLYTTAGEQVGPPASLPAEVRAALLVDAAQRDDKQRARLKEYFQATAPGLKPLYDAMIAARKARDQFDAAIPISAIFEELPAGKQRKTHMLVRGSFLNRGEPVDPGTPAVLHAFPPESPANRLGMARWLVDTSNPLTARVIMNRFWEQYFGRGLVETVEEFGVQSEPPSHPELLDWLAAEFMRSGWGMKHMHRFIVTSATYRQSSRVLPELALRDPYNRLLARGPRVRLEAEMVRDQMLAVSGLLSRKLGGPSVMPPQPDGLWQVVYSGDKWETSKGEDKYRRGLYTFWRRSNPHPVMMAFDAPSREFCVLKRSRSNTPLQALATLNDPAAIEAAQALARRVAGHSGDVKARATQAFRLVLARAPQAKETDRLVALYERELAHYQADAKAADKMANSELGPAPAGLNTAELAAWTVVANVLLNLDETITKG